MTKKIESQKSIGFIKQQRILLADKFVNIQFLVHFPRLNISLQNQFRTHSLLLFNCYLYSLGCQLNQMNTNETSLNFDYFLHHTEMEFKSVQLDSLKVKKEIQRRFGTKEQTTTDNQRTKRGAGLIALGALTAVTERARIASSLGSIFGACREFSRDREDIHLAISQIELNNHRWVKFKDKFNSKMFLLSNSKL